MAREVAARGISILGHPLVLLPLAAFVLAVSQGAPITRLALIGGFAAVGLALVAWARNNVRRKRWKHVDASNPTERGEWNKVLLASLAVLALICWSVDPPLVVAPASIGIVVLLSIALAPWLKLSQHVAFAILAASMVAIAYPIAGAACLLGVAALGWSRLVLDRHTAAEVAVGALAGLSAGVFLTLTLAALAGTDVTAPSAFQAPSS